MKTPAPARPATELPSRLAAFAASLAEACWLVAVAVIPLAYDRSVYEGFEPFKIILLRSLGILIAAALFVRGAEALARGELGKTPAAGSRGWLAVGTLLLASCLVPTFFSVDRGISVWGLTGTLQGSITLCCQLFLGLGVAIFLRTRAQMDRLVTVALAASAPVALYAVLQRVGFNPLFEPVKLLEGKSHSFAGHPLFLAGYLLMLLPFTAHRLWSAATNQGGGKKKSSSGQGIVAIYGTLLALQLGGIIAADKRGPFVALTLMIAAALILLAGRTKQFRLALWGAGIAAVFALLLLATALLKKTGALQEAAPVLGTLSKIVPLSKEVGEGTGDDYRKMMWSRAPELAFATNRYVFPEGTPDRFHLLRPLAGYGPETLPAVLSQHWPFGADGSGVSRLENRIHNYFWDTWQATGLLGVGALLALYCWVFWRGYETAGLFPGARPLHIVVASFAGGLLGGAAMSGTYGLGYFGAGFQLGFFGGLILGPFWKSWRGSSPALHRDHLADDLLTVALLVALLGHWADMAFVFPVSTTSVLFWIFVGAVAGRSLRREEPARAIRPTKAGRTTSATWVWSALTAGILAGAMLMALVHGALEGASETPFGIGDVLRAWLAEASDRPGSGHKILGFFVPAWLLTCLALGAAKSSDRGKSFGLAASLSLGLAVGYGLLKAQWIAALGVLPSPMAPAAVAVAFADGTGAISVGFLVLLLLAACAVAVALFFQSGKIEFAPATRLGQAAALAAALAACFALSAVGVAFLRSGAATRWADLFREEGRKLPAIAIYERSLQLFPYGQSERPHCAELIAELGEQEKDPARVSAAMGQAIAILEDGRKFTALNELHLHLGQTYLRWALQTAEPDLRRSLLLQAKAALQRATTFAPETEVAWFDASFVEVELGDAEAAAQKRARADVVGKTVNAEQAGDLYGARATTSATSSLKQAFAHRGLEYLDRALAEQTESLEKARADRATIQRTTYPLLLKQGTLQLECGDIQGALKCLLQAREAGRTANPWQTEAMLASTYASLGRWSEAFSSIENALQSSPVEAQERLLGLREQLQQRKLGGRPEQ